jgi:hypothetical protein
MLLHSIHDEYLSNNRMKRTYAKCSVTQLEYEMELITNCNYRLTTVDTVSETGWDGNFIPLTYRSTGADHNG